MTHTQADENNTEKDYVFTLTGSLFYYLDLSCRAIEAIISDRIIPKRKNPLTL